MGPKNGIDEDGWEIRMYLLIVFCQVLLIYSSHIIWLYHSVLLPVKHYGPLIFLNDLEKEL